MDAPDGPDGRIARLAAAQHGVVSRAQLVAAGLGRGAIASRAGRGWLHRVHVGVYAVGHPLLSDDGRRLAAVLACGPGAVLSHRSAAAAWGLRPSSVPIIDVTVLRTGGRARPGIRIHRVRRAPDATEQRSIPVTTPARTLLDLAAVVPHDHLRRAVERAEVLRIFDLAAVHEVLERHPRRAGTRRLLAAVEAVTHDDVTRSELERRFLVLCRRHRLPEPRVNVTVQGLVVDFLWPAARLVVEVDGHEHHGTRTAFERDRVRDERLVAAGYRVMRFTYRRLTGDPDGVAASLAAVLR